MNHDTLELTENALPNPAAATIYPEPCPEATDFQVPGCVDTTHIQLPQVGLSSLGRIIQVDATIRNVCPGRQVAVAILLQELGPDGLELPRGIKTILLPPQGGEACRDIVLNCVHFVVPEALDPAGAQDSICNARSFRARVLANYVDTDYVCCDADVLIS